MRRTALLSSIVFLLAFGLNLISLSPAVHPDDSPETVTAGVTLSIQHPPGYPLHALLGRLAVLSFPGSVAFRINLLAALCGALGLLLFLHVFRLLLQELLERFVPLEWALLPTAVLALSYSLWFQSSIAKGGIYTLNFALSEASLLGILAFRQGIGRIRPLLLAAFAFGLGMANHWTSQVVLLPGYALLLADLFRPGSEEPRLESKDWTWMAAFVLPGLSLYLYLPLRSLLQPAMSWGEPWTWDGFLWVFNRSQYAGIESGKTWNAFQTLAERAFEVLQGDFHPIGILGIGLGWGLLFWKRPGLALALLALPLALVGAVCLKANPPDDSLWIIDPYLLPMSSGFALGLAGWYFLERKWLSLTLALSLPLFWRWHFPLADQSENYLGYDYGKNLFLSCPKDSILFCEGDSNTSLPIFERFALGHRPDISPIALVLSDYPWYTQTLSKYNPGLALPSQGLTPPKNLEWIAAHNPARPAFLTNSYTPEWVDPKRVLLRGLVDQYLPKGSPTLAQTKSNAIWEAYELRGVFEPAVLMDPLSVRLVRDNYKDAVANLAAALQGQGDQLGAEKEFVFLGGLIQGWAAPWVQAGNCAFYRHDFEEAAYDWKRAIVEDPRSAEAQTNMGLYYFQVHDFDQALLYSRKALELDPDLPAAKQLFAQAVEISNRRQVAPAAPSQDSGAIWAQRGDLLAKAGKAEEALDAYQKALQLGFVNANVYRNCAVMQANLNRPSLAVEELIKAVNLSPRDAELHKYLGIMQFNAGNPKAALDELQVAQSITPKDPQIPNLILQIRQKLQH